MRCLVGGGLGKIGKKDWFRIRQGYLAGGEGGVGGRRGSSRMSAEGKKKGFSQIVADKGADERRFLIRLIGECGNPWRCRGFDPAEGARSAFARRIFRKCCEVPSRRWCASRFCSNDCWQEPWMDYRRCWANLNWADDLPSRCSHEDTKARRVTKEMTSCSLVSLCLGGEIANNFRRRFRKNLHYPSPTSPGNHRKESNAHPSAASNATALIKNIQAKPARPNLRDRTSQHFLKILRANALRAPSAGSNPTAFTNISRIKICVYLRPYPRQSARTPSFKSARTPFFSLPARSA